MNEYDVIKEYRSIVNEQQEVIKWQERDNTFLLIILSVMCVWLFITAVWL